MKNDPNNPTQEFYSHSGAVSIERLLYATILKDYSTGQQKLRMYNLNANNVSSEIFSETIWGKTYTNEKEIENTWLTHNILDQSLAFVSWPENYMLIYITDLLFVSEITQEFGMSEFQTADYYHVYLNMQAALQDKYTLKVGAKNIYSDIEVNKADLSITINLGVSERKPLELNLAQSAYVYIDLHQYYNFENLAAVIDGQWYDANETFYNKTVPQVQSCYSEVKTEFMRGDTYDLLWQNSKLFVLYKHQVTKKVHLAIWTIKSLQFIGEIETDLPENARFGRIIENDVLEEYIVTVSDVQDQTQVNIFQQSPLKQAFYQQLPFQKIDFWLTSGFNDELYVILTTGQQNIMISYVKTSLADQSPFQFAWYYNTTYAMKYIGSDYWMQIFIACTEKSIDFYSFENGKLTQIYQNLEASEYLGALTSCYYNEDNTILVLTSSYGGYEYLVQDDYTVRDTSKFYSAYKQIFDKDFRSLFLDSDNNLLITANQDIPSFHILQYKRDEQSSGLSVGQSIVVQTSIPISQPQKCVVQSKSNTYNIKYIFCTTKGKTHQIDVFVIYNKPLVVIEPENSLVHFNGTITFYQTYNPWRNVTFQNVYGTLLDQNQYVVLTGRSDMHGDDLISPGQIQSSLSYTSESSSRRRTLKLLENNPNIKESLVWIPASNYFSGHDLSVTCSLLVEKLEDANIECNVAEKYNYENTTLRKTVHEVYSDFDIWYNTVSQKNESENVIIFILYSFEHVVHTYIEVAPEKGIFNFWYEIEIPGYLSPLKASLWQDNVLSGRTFYIIECYNQNTEKVQFKVYDVSSIKQLKVVEIDYFFEGKSISDYPMIIKNMEVWNSLLFDINQDAILIYKLLYDRITKKLQFTALPELTAENIRDFTNLTFQPEDFSIDKKAQVLRVFEKSAKGIYSFDISKLSAENPKIYKTISRPAVTNYQSKSDQTVLEYGENYIMALTTDYEYQDGALSQLEIQGTGGAQLMFQQKYMNCGEDVKLCYYNALAVNKYFTAVAMQSQGANYELYNSIKIFSNQYTAFDNEYTQIPIGFKSKIKFRDVNQNWGYQWLYVVGGNEMLAVRLYPGTDKGVPTTKDLVPTYNPTVVWAYVSIQTPSNFILTKEAIIDVILNATHIPLNFSEIYVNDKKKLGLERLGSEPSQSTDLKLVFEPSHGGFLTINQEKFDEVEIFNKELTQIVLSPKDELIYDIPFSAFYGQSPFIDLYINNTFYSPSNFNFENKLVVSYERKFFEYFREEGQTTQEKYYKAISTYTDDEFLLLLPKGQVQKCSHEYSGNCENLKLDLPSDCSLLATNKVKFTADRDIQELDYLISFVCQENKINYLILYYQYKYRGQTTLRSNRIKLDMKPTFLRAYYSKDQFIEQDQGVSRSYITLIDAPTDLNKFYIYELIPKLESDPERTGQFVVNFQVRSWKHNYADLQVSGLVITDSDYDGDLKIFILGDKSGRLVVLKRLYDYSRFQKMQTIDIPQPQFTQLTQYNQPMSVRVVGHQNTYVKVIVIMQYGDIYLMQLDDSDLKIAPTWQDFSSTINDPNYPSEFYMIHSFAISEDRQLMACGLISSNLFKIRVFRLQDITFDYEEIHMEYDLSKIHGISSQDISNSNENTNNIIFMSTQNWPSLAYVTPLMWDTSNDQVGLVQVRPQSIQVRFLGQDIGDTNLFVNQQNLDNHKLGSPALSNQQTKQIDRFLSEDKEKEDEKMYYYKITINGSNSHSQVHAKEFILILNTSNPTPEPPGPPDYDDDKSSDDDNDDVVLILVIVLVGSLIVILLVLIVICCIKRKRDVKKQQEVNEARGRLLNAYAGTQLASIDEEDIHKAGFAMAELQGTMYLIPPQPLQKEHGGQLSAQVLIPITEEEQKSEVQQQRRSRKFNLANQPLVGVKKSSQRVTGIELQQKLAPPSILESGDNDL